jgi:hypothetical protein
MSEYHVGCGAFRIYAGTLNKKGDMWTHKSDVTLEAMGAVAQHLLEHKSVFRFEYKGKQMVLKVEESESDGKN